MIIRLCALASWVSIQQYSQVVPMCRLEAYIVANQAVVRSTSVALRNLVRGELFGLPALFIFNADGRPCFVST